MVQIRKLPLLRTLGRAGKPWNRGDKIALWLGICTLLLTAIGLYQTYLVNSKDPSLELAAVSALDTQEIDASDQDVDGRVLGSNRVEGQRLDITVRNAGSAEALVTRAELTFRQATRLARCQEVGGEVEITANYGAGPLLSAARRTPTEVLQRAGANGQVVVLAERAAAGVSLDNPNAVAGLLEVLQQVGRVDRSQHCWPAIPPLTSTSTARRPSPFC